MGAGRRREGAEGDKTIAEPRGQLSNGEGNGLAAARQRGRWIRPRTTNRSGYAERREVRGKVDSLFCGKATPVARCHRHLAKSRLKVNWPKAKRGRPGSCPHRAVSAPCAHKNSPRTNPGAELIGLSFYGFIKEAVNYLAAPVMKMTISLLPRSNTSITTSLASSRLLPETS